jgi:hypothetical protein
MNPVEGLETKKETPKQLLQECIRVKVDHRYEKEIDETVFIEESPSGGHTAFFLVAKKFLTPQGPDFSRNVEYVNYT